LKKAIEDETARAADDLLRESPEDHENDRKRFEAFRISLVELAESLRVTKKSDQNSSRTPPLVFVLDELDRCRPPFALALIENIKHFFSVPGVVFILVTNLQQLESAVGYAYGPRIDARSYLQKFYHLRVILPARTNVQNRDVQSRYLHFLFSKIAPFADNQGPFIGSIQSQLEYLARVRLLSLREIERIVSYVTLTLMGGPHSSVFMEPFLVGLCVIKVLDPAAYESVRIGSLKFIDAEKLLRFDEWRDIDSIITPRIATNVGNWWKVVLSEPISKNEGAQYYTTLDHFNFKNPIDMLIAICRIIDGLQLSENS
jgi:hypothetical protein